MSEKYQRILIAFLILADVILVFLMGSTYDSGDSILHYLQSKQSFEHHRYFLDVWAKPVFILLSSPFAHFGFVGMKLFNTICMLLTIHLCYLLVKPSYPKYAFAMYIIGLFAVHVFLIQSSGLTEPLIALFIAAGMYFIRFDKTSLAMILISFTPLIRSEGYIFIGVFALFAIMKGQWKSLFLLTIGTLTYCVIGYFYHHDFLWLFHQNPYQGIEKKYGSGALLHYVHQLPYLIGWPVFIFLVLGVVKQLFNLGQLRSAVKPISVLALGCFAGLLLAHSVFWYLGWFHSFGLKRVLLASTGPMLVLAFDGLMWIVSSASRLHIKRSLLGGLLLITALFPFSKNKAGFEIPDDFQLHPAQVLVQNATDWYNTHHKDKPKVCFGNYYFAETLAVDIDDQNDCLLIDAVTNNLVTEGMIVFWDDYFCVTDKGVSETAFKDAKSYKKLMTFENSQGNRIVVFQKLPTQNLGKN